MAHISQIAMSSSSNTVYALCCDGVVRTMVMGGLGEDDAAEPCGPGCAWEKAKKTDAMLAAVQAAEKASHVSNEIAAGNAETLKGAMKPAARNDELLNAYRRAYADLSAYRHDVVDADSMDAHVLAEWGRDA